MKWRFKNVIMQLKNVRIQCIAESKAFLVWLRLYTSEVDIFVFKQVVINYIGVCQFILECTYFSKFFIALICSNLWMNQSASSIIDHPKMSQFSKKANLLKDFGAVATSHTVKVILSLFSLGFAPTLNAEDLAQGKLNMQ